MDSKAIEPAELDAFLAKKMEELKIPGLSIAVINDSDIVYHRSQGVTNNSTMEKVDNQTIFEAASMSKPVFTYLVMRLVEKGMLDLDTPLYTYMPYEDIAHDERYKLITARMVLTHTSGFPNWRFQNKDGKLDIKFTPGTQYNYSGEGFEYLAKVIAHLSGKSLQTLDYVFQEEVAQPLGLENSFFIWNDKIEKHKAYGHEEGKPVSDRSYTDLTVFGASHSLHTTAEDYAKFMIAIMNEKGLKKETYQEMLKEHVRLPEGEYLRDEMGFDSFSLGFIRDESPSGLKHLHGGVNPNFQAYFMIIKDKKYGFVFFANADNGLELMEPLENFLLQRQK